MTRSDEGSEKRPGRARLTRAELIPFAIVVVGMVLGFTVHMGFNILTALGLFGPGLLREIGLLKDRDEYQHQLAMTAGYRAYLLGGLLLMLLIIVKSWGLLDLDHERVSAGLVLLFFLVVYFLSYLFSFWGAQKASFRILCTFGTFWLIFVVLSNFGQPIAMLMQLAVPLPFFVLAFSCRRWPRITGVVLLALGIFGFFFFKMYRAFDGQTGRFAAWILMFLPVLASGFALLGTRSRREDG